MQLVQACVSHTVGSVGACKTILLVEDTPELLATLRQLLEGCGYKVICAASGHAAVDAMHSTQDIDILVTDVIIPDLDGDQLIEAAMRLVPNIHVLAMSGGRILAKSRADIRQLSKPFAAKDLLAAVREMIESP